MGNCVGSRILKLEDRAKKIIIGTLLNDQMGISSVASGILEREDQAKKIIIGCLLSDQMGDCVGSGILKREEDQETNISIIGSQLRDQDSTDCRTSNASANFRRLPVLPVEHAAASCCGSISRLSLHPPSVNSQKRQIRGSEEEKKQRVLGRCCRIKVVISAKRLSEMLRDGHTSKEVLLSFLFHKLQAEGRSRSDGVKLFGKQLARNRFAAAWTPSLEVIPEEDSKTRNSVDS